MTRHLAILSCALVLAGCSVLRPHTDRTEYFVLTSDQGKPAEPPAQVVLGLDRVDLPEYLMRSELVTRTGENQLKIADDERWAEPLKDGFTRTLRTDLEKQLGAGHVVTTPFDPAHRPGVIVDIEVRRCEAVAAEGAVLEATWTLRDGSSGAVLVSKQAHVSGPTAGRDGGSTVAALSKAVAGLAAQIAEVVRTRRDRTASR